MILREVTERQMKLSPILEGCMAQSQFCSYYCRFIASIAIKYNLATGCLRKTTRTHLALRILASSSSWDIVSSMFWLYLVCILNGREINRITNADWKVSSNLISVCCSKRWSFSSKSQISSWRNIIQLEFISYQKRLFSNPNKTANYICCKGSCIGNLIGNLRKFMHKSTNTKSATITSYIILTTSSTSRRNHPSQSPGILRKGTRIQKKRIRITILLIRPNHYSCQAKLPIKAMSDVRSKKIWDKISLNNEIFKHLLGTIEPKSDKDKIF